MAKPAARRPAKPAASHTPALEWAVAALGLLCVLAALAVIVAGELNAPAKPPLVTVRAAGVEAAAGGWLVRFEAINRGGQAAAEVQVTGKLAIPGHEVESRSVVLDYVPKGARRRGYLVFPNDPQAGQLELAADGYREP